jgi:peptidoglycan/LPS O-acetylase OafA/YrhL
VIRKNRIYELDVLRFVAILLVLLCHIRFFVSTEGVPALQTYETYLGIWGVIIFLFIAGVLLPGSRCGSVAEVKSFLIKRAVRIYPLYWLSLGTTFLIFGYFSFRLRGFEYNVTLENFMVNAAGLQVFFPAFKIPAMWYIGVILLFYLVYAGLSCLTKGNMLQFSIGALILLICMGLLKIGGYLDDRVTDLFFIFIAGVLTGELLLASYQSSYIAPRWIVMASYAAFSVYLFQFQILALWSVILSLLTLPVTVTTILCGFPLIFITGYGIQYGFDLITGK